MVVQLGTMYSSITLIHSSALSFRPGSTKCNEGAVSQAPMMPETITPRVVSVCDAVNRSGVSSSSSAPTFEVLRHRQILGNDTLKLSGTRARKCAENRTRRSTEGLVAMLCTRRRLREKDMCQDTCEIWLTPTDPRVLMVGLLAQPEKGLVRPDDVAELQLWSSWRIVSMEQETWTCDKARTWSKIHEIAERCVADSTKQPKQRGRKRSSVDRTMLWEFWKTLGILRQTWLVVCGYVIKSVMCVGVHCRKNLLFYDKFYNGCHFWSKGVWNLMFFPLISPPPSFIREFLGKM